MSARLALALVIAAGLAVAACQPMRWAYRHAGFGAPAPTSADAPEPARAARLEAQAASMPTRDETTGDETPTRGEREVEFPAVAESVTSSLFPEGAAARFAAANVPVLAPGAMSREQAAAFLSSFRPTPDGFLARLRLEGYDVVMNGTRAYAVAPESAGAPRRDTTSPQISESENGMSATFSRFGADYSIDFVCRGAGGEEGSECVTEAQAAEFVERLIPVGGGGR